MTTDTDNMTRHLQTTHLFHAEESLILPEHTTIRYCSADEALELATSARKRNVFARHSWESNFYVQKLESLGGTTLIETLRPGDPDDILSEARIAADVAEKVSLLSTVLVTPRRSLLRQVGNDLLRGSKLDIAISPQFRYLRTKSGRRIEKRGVNIDKKFKNRFNRCGIPGLFSLCTAKAGLSSRLRSAVGWLAESRQDSYLPAALVKTSIALETLLIFSESESLARSLSERTAFILSSDSLTRQRISSIVKTFYDARSGVVHGSEKKAKKLTPNLLEAMDRLIALMCVTIAANTALWTAKEDIQEWCERERWGSPSRLVRRWSLKYLSNAILLSQP